MSDIVITENLDLDVTLKLLMNSSSQISLTGKPPYNSVSC